MGSFQAGQHIAIPCEIQPGPFPDERLISVQTESGPVSGFVNAEDLLNVEDGKGRIRGVVREATEQTLTVWISGSFFTTNGLAYLSRDWAKSHVRELVA